MPNRHLGESYKRTVIEAFVQAGARQAGGESRSNQRVKYLICCTALEDNVCMSLYSVFTWALEHRDKGICLKIRVTYFWEAKICCDENERKQIVLLKWSDMFGFFTMYALISLFKLNSTFLYLDIKTQNG